MEANVILIGFLGMMLAGAIGLVLWAIFGRKSGDDMKMQILQSQQIENLQKQLEISNSHLMEMMRNMENKVLGSEREQARKSEFQFQESQKQFESAQHLIKEITREITEVKEGNKQVLTMTEQLSNLEKVLTNQKQRGNWGESSLQLILSNFLSDENYQMQYTFQNGEAVDAIIRIQDKILPIDSKFSLDNYQRCIDTEIEEDKKYYAEEFKKDLKLRITETAKYVRENEGTLPIAFMFIPSEAIYYDLLAGEQSRIKVNTQALIEYAQKQRVFIVSPTSILAYLHLVLSGLKAFKVEENAKQIQKKVEDLGTHILKFEEGYKKLGNSLGAVVNHYNSSYTQLKNIDRDVYKITDGEAGKKIEVEKLDRPQNILEE